MSRKAIPDDVQNSILTKSRRRCCLCFWLEGVDEVQKGQIAHIDQNNENPEEDNLAFLCLVHHDEYDGRTSVSKGLRSDEIKHWRNELYREMQYRFRTVAKKSAELTLVGFLDHDSRGFKARFRVKNTGEAVIRTPTISIKLPNNVSGELPRRRREDAGGVGGFGLDFEPPDMFGMYESKQDLFEPRGRVAIKELNGVNPILMPDHSFPFNGLYFPFAHFGVGVAIRLDYRIDAEEMTPVLGSLDASVPSDDSPMLLEQDGE